MKSGHIGPILKKRSSVDTVGSSAEIRPILKRKDARSDPDFTPKPIIKSKSTSSEESSPTVTRVITQEDIEEGLKLVEKATRPTHRYSSTPRRKSHPISADDLNSSSSSSTRSSNGSSPDGPSSPHQAARDVLPSLSPRRSSNGVIHAIVDEFDKKVLIESQQSGLLASRSDPWIRNGHASSNHVDDDDGEALTLDNFN